MARSSAGAVLVALGILASRLAGLVRQKVMAHFLGSSEAADAFNAAFRIPNLLQNLFGEGALSASFIPVYASLLAKGEHAAADRVAGAVGTLLALVCSALVAVGVVAAPSLVWAIAPGFSGETGALTTSLVRVLFPGAGLLVVSAWCLGILNSHRKFLLSYAAPVVWNAAMIAALLWYGLAGATGDALVVPLAWASVAGSALQFLVQVPSVVALAPGLRPSLALGDPDVRAIVRNFAPAFVSRGVMQLSSYVDSIVASLLPSGSVAVFGYAQTLYSLPVSLFGMAVTAAELPDLAAIGAGDAAAVGKLVARLNAGLARIAFFVIPSAVAFLVVGDALAAGLFQSGAFGADDVNRTWAALAGSSVGMLAQTWARLYASTFFALRDTRTPLYVALVRVVASGGLGFAFATFGPAALGVDARWGIAGLTLGSGLAGWLEYTLLRWSLERRVGPTGAPRGDVAKSWLLAAVAGGVGAGLGQLPLPPVAAAVVVVAGFGVVYLGGAAAFGMPELHGITRRLRGR
jgi:putative peptidoglycan lipid II flippase